MSRSASCMDTEKETQTMARVSLEAQQFVSGSPPVPIDVPRLVIESNVSGVTPHV